MLELFQVRLSTGDHCAVTSEGRLHGLVIHRRIIAGGKDGCVVGSGWSVSHEATGLLLWSSEERVAVEAVAQWLVGAVKIPIDAVGALQWSHALPLGERLGIRLHMQKLAPRI